MLPVLTVKAEARNYKYRWTVDHCLIVLFLLGSRWQVCTAQEKPQQNIPTLRTQSNVVFVPTLVTDHAGKLIFGLQEKDFIIEDRKLAALWN